MHITSMLAVGPRDLFNIVFSLLLAMILSIIISQIYKYTHEGLSYELTFMTTLVTLGPIVSIVMLFIRGDLVLSLGLIGSLSIVRFRTPIKDTKDMVYIFWIIAVGLGCGTYNWVVVIVSTILISILIFILHYIRYGKTYDLDYVLVIAGNGANKSKDINNLIQGYAKNVRIRSKESEDDFWETIYELRFNKEAINITDTMLEEIRSIDGVSRVSLLAPQITLPV